MEHTVNTKTNHNSNCLWLKVNVRCLVGNSIIKNLFQNFWCNSVTLFDNF